MAVVNNLKETRKNRGIPQKDIACATGFSIKIIGRIERGEQDPSAEFMLRVATYFGLLVEDMFQVREYH